MSSVKRLCSWNWSCSILSIIYYFLSNSLYCIKHWRDLIWNKVQSCYFEVSAPKTNIDYVYVLPKLNVLYCFWERRHSSESRDLVCDVSPISNMNIFVSRRRCINPVWQIEDYGWFWAVMMEALWILQIPEANLIRSWLMTSIFYPKTHRKWPQRCKFSITWGKFLFFQHKRNIITSMVGSRPSFSGGLLCKNAFFQSLDIRAINPSRWCSDDLLREKKDPDANTVFFFTVVMPDTHQCLNKWEFSSL